MRTLVCCAVFVFETEQLPLTPSSRSSKASDGSEIIQEEQESILNLIHVMCLQYNLQGITFETIRFQYYVIP